MTTADLNAAFAATLVDEWARGRVTDACLAPGSRSTPLALALDADPRIRVHVHLDERSAAFFALGAAKASGLPAVVLCTSGTAAANLHPAVLEAFHSRTPLIVATADRPPELRHTGANQTVDQLGLFGGAARFFCEVGVPEAVPGAGRYWRSIGARSLGAALGPPAGPVHLNLAFREPFVSSDGQGGSTTEPGRSDGAPWTRSVPGASTLDPRALDELIEVVVASERGVVVTGWGAGCPGEVVERFAEAAGWPILADPLSGARNGHLAISTYEALLRCPAFAAGHRPDLVVRLGASLTGRVSAEWLDASVRQVVMDPDGA
ncbi:MAG: 2-succinyl-5-enolpyruvyl-6-hydroxy-3-cyclohexene-1-carboxylic-acid synthase, partial [Acidimicrobiia bacterium]